jgi:hypothetical protein
MSNDDTRCPWCKGFYPTTEIEAHKRTCSFNPANK